MAEERKYYVRVQGTRVEVTEEVYHAFYSVERHLLTLDEKDQRNGKILYSDLDTEDMLGEEMISDYDAVSVEDAAIANIQYQQLHQALKLLSESERMLIHAVYFEGLSERKVAERTGIHYMTIHSRKVSILKNLKELMNQKTKTPA